MLTICGENIANGTKKIIKKHVVKDLGMDINITAHVWAGKEDGPTLLITSLLHGHEWFTALFIREFFKRLDINALKGNIIAIPVANVSAFNANTRCMNDNSDEPDANRAFGGIYNCLSNAVTRVIEEEFMSKADCLIDYHIGTWGNRMADVTYGSDYADEKVVKDARGMALAYGFPVLHAQTMFQATHSNRNCTGRAGQAYGIPGIGPEVGGIGYGKELEAQWIDQNVRGIFGVLKYFNMIEGEPEYCEKYLQYKGSDYWRVSNKNGGYVEVVLDCVEPMTEVKKDQLLANLIDPETFEVLEEIRSPGDGYIFYSCRDYMVRPGGWVFGVVSTEDSTWLTHLS